MQIAIVFHKFPKEAVKFVKMFCLKPLKINVNTVLKTIVFSIYSCILSEFVYCIFVKDVMISYLNVYAVIKEDY